MIGDRMDTDIVSGMEAGLHTILVLTGVTTKDQVDRYPFRPSRSSTRSPTSSIWWNSCRVLSGIAGSMSA